jgi:methanogenic corrinoid protein MtbC1
MTLSSMTQVDVAVGIAGTDSMWDTSVDIVSDAMNNNGYNNIIDMGVHNSLASSLVTLVVKANPIMIASHAANTFTLSLDYLTSMHFLDNDKFLAVQQLMVDNQVKIPHAPVI